MFEGVQNESGQLCAFLARLVAIDLVHVYDVLGFGGSLVVLGAAFEIDIHV